MSEDKGSALLVVDMQNDFLPGGALPVAEGDELVPVLNRYIARFAEAGLFVVFSRDWHPEETAHFEEFGGPWPPHCVQNTEGAEYHPDLKVPDAATIVSKGMGWDAESYSAFLAHDENERPLEQLLRENGVERLYVGGVALDYCVKMSVLEALEKGFAATLLIDATRAVNREVHDGEEAVEEMVRAGAEVLTIEHLAIEE